MSFKHKHCPNHSHLRTKSYNKKMFCGVFSSDKLPQMIDNYPCRFVANTDLSTKPGKHWISICISPSEGQGESKKIMGEYFDSYRTDVPLVFRNYLEKHTEKWIYNKRKLQSIWPTYAVIIVYSA